METSDSNSARGSRDLEESPHENNISYDTTPASNPDSVNNKTGEYMVKFERSLNHILNRLDDLEEISKHKSSRRRRHPSRGRSRARRSPSRHRRHRSRPRSRDSHSSSSNSSRSRSRSRYRSRRNSSRSSEARSNRQRRTNSSRSRRDSQSPSEYNHKRTRSDSDDSSSDTDRSRSRTPRVKRKRHRSPQGDSNFIHNGEVYTKFNKKKHKHVPNQPAQILWGDSIITVKWHTTDDNVKGFCQIKASTVPTPYMDKKATCSLLSEQLDFVPWLGDNTGLRRDGFSTPFEKNTGLAMALDLFWSIEDTVVNSLLKNNKKAALKAFAEKHFDSPAIAIFSKDWPKGEYFAWAKGQLLDLEKTADVLDINKTTKVGDSLEEENYTRALLVNYITGLTSLDTLGEKFKDDKSTQSTIFAIAKLFLFALKTLIVNWMEAKMKLRRIILHGQDTEAVRILLKSNMWLPCIFPEDALEKAKNTKAYSGIRNILNLHKDGSYRDPYYYNKKKSKNFNKNHSYNERYNKGSRNSYRKKEYYDKQPTQDSFRTSRNQDDFNQSKPSTSKSSPQKKNFQSGKNKKKGKSNQ